MLIFGGVWVIWEKPKKLSTKVVCNSANSEPILGVPIYIKSRFEKPVIFWFKHKMHCKVWAGKQLEVVYWPQFIEEKPGFYRRQTNKKEPKNSNFKKWLSSTAYILTYRSPKKAFIVDKMAYFDVKIKGAYMA